MNITKFSNQAVSIRATGSVFTFIVGAGLGRRAVGVICALDCSTLRIGRTDLIASVESSARIVSSAAITSYILGLEMP